MLLFYNYNSFFVSNNILERDDFLTEEEYLRERISDLTKILSNPFLSRKKRINQTTALRFYQSELDKTIALKNKEY